MKPFQCEICKAEAGILHGAASGHALCPVHGGPAIIVDNGHLFYPKPGPALTQGPDDAGDGAALRESMGNPKPGTFLDGIERQLEKTLGLKRREPEPVRPTLNRHAGELAIELARYAAANAPGAALARPLTAYETHYAAHIAAFLHHGFRQAVKALEGDDAGAADALKLAMIEARAADAARRVVAHEDAIRSQQ